MDYDFVVDTAKLSELIELINEKSESISEVESSIVSEIGGIQNDQSWDGDAYELFSSKTSEYQGELEAMVDYLLAYSTSVNDVVSQASTLNQAIVEACNIGG